MLALGMFEKSDGLLVVALEMKRNAGQQQCGLRLLVLNQHGEGLSEHRFELTGQQSLGQRV